MNGRHPGFGGIPKGDTDDARGRGGGRGYTGIEVHLIFKITKFTQVERRTQ